MLQEVEHIALPQIVDISLSRDASKALMEVISERNLTGMALRVSVAFDSHSRSIYSLGFDDTLHGNDIVINKNGLRLVVDGDSAEFLEGAKIDYVKDGKRGPGFIITSPNDDTRLHSDCGCGGACSCQG